MFTLLKHLFSNNESKQQSLPPQTEHLESASVLNRDLETDVAQVYTHAETSPSEKDPNSMEASTDRFEYAVNQFMKMGFFDQSDFAAQAYSAQDRFAISVCREGERRLKAKSEQNFEKREIYYLEVPFQEKDEVKEMGAYWDSKKRKWYVPKHVDGSYFVSWYPKTIRLEIELVPMTTWYKNVRSHFTDEQWKQLKKLTAQKANYRCEICMGKGEKWPVECHEVWNYDEMKKVQILERLIALCPLCHKAKHIGRCYATQDPDLDNVIQHLMKLNLWNRTMADDYINYQFRTWKRRSHSEWTLDMSVISNKYGTLLKSLQTNPKRSIRLP